MAVLFQTAAIFLSFVMLTESLDCSSGLLKSYQGSDIETNIKFSVIMSLRRPGEDMKCGTIIESQLQVLAAVHWAVERINDKGFLPFAKLGYDLYDDCGFPWYTAQGLQDLYGCHLTTPRNVCVSSGLDTCSDMGLLALTRNMAEKDIQDFAFRNDIPVVSPFLSKKDAPANFRTMRENDMAQEKILIRLIQELGWTYVAAVHTNDDYSRATIQTFQDLARNESICVNVLGSIPIAFGKNESSKIVQMVDSVWKAREEAGTGTLGVIYHGNGYSGTQFAKALRKRIQDSGENSPIQLILSEHLSDWKEEMIDNIALPENTFMLQPKAETLREFEDTYNTVFTMENYTSLNNNSLEESLRAFFEDTGRTPSAITNQTKNPLMAEAVDSVFTVVTAYLKAQRQKCGSLKPSSNCDGLKTMAGSELVAFVQGVVSSYDELPNNVAPTEFVTLRRLIGKNPGLDVVQFSTSGNGLQIQQVASIDNAGFTWTFEDSHLPVSACHGSCLPCSSLSPYQYAYVPGDILLVGVFPVHSSKLGSPFECGEYKASQIHRVLPEAFFYGLKKIRERTGINFGGIAFDSCESAPRMLQTISDFLAGDVKLTNHGTTEVIDPKKARLVLGGFNSGVTVPLSMFLTNLGIPVVSYAASTPDLDDRLNFPYFLRSVPSDVEQAQAMVSVIKEMKWEYVSVLYVDNNYGTKGKQAFIEIATEAGICVTEPPLALSQVRKENEDNDVLTLLRNQKPEVVVLFVIEERVAQFLQNQQMQFERIGQADNIIYLASEDWGQSQKVLDEGKTRTLGSITLKLGTSHSADKESFANYMKSKTLTTQTHYDTFFNEMWANEFQCSPDETFDSAFKNRCGSNLRISDTVAAEWEKNQRIVHTLNAMFAIGDGIKQERDKLCNGEDEFICQDFEDHPAIVTAAIKNARFFDSGKEFAVFGEDGNGITGFDVLNVQKDTGGVPHYVKIGSFSKGELILDRNKLTFYNGEVEAKCGSDHCEECERQTTSSNDINGGICSTFSAEELHMRNVDTAIITILAAICVLLIAKTIYDTLRFRRFTSKQNTQNVKKNASQISLGDMRGNCSTTESGGYSAGSLNYSGGSLQYSGGSLSPQNKYDKPPPPRRFVRPEDDSCSERYSENPVGAANMRKENVDYLQPSETRKTESHIYNTPNIAFERDV